MTREEMKVIISVYQLWLTEKKEELVADLCEAACAEPKGKPIENKRRSRKAMSALVYDFAGLQRVGPVSRQTLALIPG